MNGDSTSKLPTAEETVLLIDDDETVAEVGKQMLKCFGYKVVSANSGNSALEFYKENQNRIDMIILDMVLPDMDGGDAYDRLKEINPGIKVLLASGYDIDHQAKDILERGCDDFIQKPFSISQISEKVRGILASK